MVCIQVLGLDTKAGELRFPLAISYFKPDSADSPEKVVCYHWLE